MSGLSIASIQSASAGSTRVSTAWRSLPSTVSSSSASRMPACAFTISARAQKRDAVAVREAATLPPGDELALRVGDRRQLVEQAALADPGHTDERHELWRPFLAHAGQAERSTSSSRSLPTSVPRLVVEHLSAEARTGFDRLPHGDRLGLALRLDRLGLAVLDGVASRPVRRLADEDPVHGSGGLETSCRVDDVAGGHPLSGVGARIERHERFAGRDPDPELEPLLDREVANGERGADGSLRIVLVRDGCAEQRHHRVADELLDRAAVALELRANTLVVGPEDRLHVLRVHRLRLRREADEVAEDNRDDLALSACHGERVRRGRAILS